MRRIVADRLTRDDGASIIIVVICLTVIMGAAALAVDAGSLWASRRAIITATDSAALAAADYLVNQPTSAACQAAVSSGVSSGAGAQSTNYLQNNQSSSTLDSFQLAPYHNDCGTGAGKVTIRASMPAPLTFAPTIGISSASASALSVAEYGPLISAEGLRPIGICAQDPHIQAWIAAGGNPLDPNYLALRGSDPTYPIYAGAGVVNRIYFTKQLSSSCGSSPGNWGWLNFAGGGANALTTWLLNGYPGPVSIGDTVPGKTGADAATQAALNTVLCPVPTPAANCPYQFPIVVYDTATGNGSNVVFHVVDFIGLVLRGFNNVTGNPNNQSYFDFEFTNLIAEGTIGITSTGGIPPLKGVHLCGGGYGSTVDTSLCDLP